MMRNSPGALIGVILTLLCADVTRAGQMPGEGQTDAEGAQASVRVDVDPQGRTTVLDTVNRYRVVLPGAYWEYTTPDQMAAQAPQGPGCAPGRRQDPSVLLTVTHKDANAGLGLQLLPERFLVRTPEDLEGYVDASQEALRKQAGSGVMFDNARWIERDGMKIHRCEFERSQGEMTAKFAMARYFVHPEGEDVRVYQLVAMGMAEDFVRAREDMEGIVDSFRFTGTVDGSFFVPDAAPEKLPSAQPMAAPGACGQLGVGGILPAVILVIIAYYLIVVRRRKAAGGM